MGFIMDDYHMGRSWSGTALEDSCPCPKAPCGLVDFGAPPIPVCDQHNPENPFLSRTMRQVHKASQCPG